MKQDIPSMDHNIFSRLQTLEDFQLVLDTEYYQSEDIENLGIETLSIPWYIPELDAIGMFDKDDLDVNFHPLEAIFTQLGLNVKTEYKKRSLTSELNEKWVKYEFKVKSLSKVKDEFFSKVEVKEILEKSGLDENQIIQDKKTKKLDIKEHEITIELVFFFEFADLFRVFGTNRYGLLKNNELDQYRTIKIFKGSLSEEFFINGRCFKIKYQLRDLMFAFPPGKNSLDNQAKTFGVPEILNKLSESTNNPKIQRLIGLSKNKLKLSEAIKEFDGKEFDELYLKSNMNFVRDNYPQIFADYAKVDTLVTYGLSKALRNLLKEVCELLDIEKQDLQETCGANVQKVLIAIIKKHFIDIVKDNLKEGEVLTGKDIEDLGKSIEKIITMAKVKNLSKLTYNAYGYIPFQTSGGLLFSRMVKQLLVEGTLLDLDLSSCYATALTNMNLYLGEAKIYTITSNNIRIKDLLPYFERYPKDSWFFRVSGELNEAVNTLIINCNEFDSQTINKNPKKFGFPEFIDLEKETLNDINANKASDPNSISSITTKSINHGVFTYATYTALSDLPDSWLEEFLNLKIDTVAYHPERLMTDSLKDYHIERKILSDKNEVRGISEGDRILDVIQHLNGAFTISHEVHNTPNNVSLKFPIYEYYRSIKELRSKYKLDGNPIQGIFKLILNSTYGIIASLVMKVNNPVAANWITSCARASAWRMTNALNGFAPITDGTSFKWETIPFDKTFREILEANPNYLTHYDANITHDKVLPSISEEMDLNQIYKDHLVKFLGKSDWLTDLYDYALKDEKDKNKVKHFEYSEHISWNSGNYIKSSNKINKLKMRSYQKSDVFQKAIKDRLLEDYKLGLIYCDTSVVKLSKGTIEAKSILKEALKADKGVPLSRMPKELAEGILEHGLTHPMGLSKKNVKIPKLIGLSQFNFPNKEVYKQYSKLFDECQNISKVLLDWKTWQTLDNKNSRKLIEKHQLISKAGLRNVRIDPYIPFKTYYYFNRDYPCGLGFELLCLGFEGKNKISEIREYLDTLNSSIYKGEVKCLKKYLHWTDQILPKLRKNRQLLYYLAAIQIAKLNAVLEYRYTLFSSTSDPMSYVVKYNELTSYEDKLRLSDNDS